MEANHILNTFLSNEKNVYSFVLSKELEIIESNRPFHSGLFKKYLINEDLQRLKSHISKSSNLDFYAYLKIDSNNIKPIKFSIWFQEDSILLIGKTCNHCDFFTEDKNSNNLNKTFSVLLDTNKKVVESNHPYFKVSEKITVNTPEYLEIKLNAAFDYCLQKKLVTGFEYSESNDLNNAIKYRLYPEDDRIQIIIQELNFNEKVPYSENYFRQIIDNSVDFIYNTDSKGYFIYVNEIAKERYQLAHKPKGRIHFSEWIREDYRETVSKFYQSQINSKIETTYLEFPTITKDGEELWIGQNVSIDFSGDWILSIQTTARDITENKIIEGELMEIQSKNQTILDTIPDSMFLIDKDLTLLDKKEEEDSYFFDINVGDTLQTSSLSIKNLALTIDTITSALAKQQIEKIELSSDLTGTNQIYDIRIAPVNLFQVLILIRNITETIQQQRNLQISQDKERHALDAKQKYLSFMTHEIRTPLNAIMGMTDLMFDTQPTPTQTEYLKTIKSSNRKLSKIINDVLDFNKLENNKINIEKINFELDVLIKDIIQTCSFYSNSKPIKLHYNIPSNIPKVLEGDSGKLTQILTNLISNALKFTNEGSVTLNVKPILVEEDNTFIEFAVTDTGIGIPSDKIAQVFNSYEQINAQANRKYGGTGLGLTISQKFTELMGGKIDLSSATGKGSTFSFTIPLSHTEESPKQEKTPTKVDLTSFHLLLVEDNEMNQLVMSKYFKKWGLSYDIAENGLEALKMIEEREYNLILLDLEMPVMDGFETAERIRNHDNNDINSTIIIALSASVFSEVEERTKTIGFNDFIGKPINANYVYLKLTEYLLGENAHFTSKNMTTSSINKDSFDLSYLLESSLNDPKYVKKMVGLFLSKTPDYINELFELLENKNFVNLRKLAHKFKASVSIMGIKEAEVAIHKLETNISKKENLDNSLDLLTIVKTSTLQACKEIKEHMANNTLIRPNN